MKAAFIIYCRAAGIYALLTLPAFLLPELYFMSLMYVLVFGWCAWFVFTTLYILLNQIPLDFVPKLFALFIATTISVAFAYHMIGAFGLQDDVWHSAFIIFPFVAVIAGWISICVSRETIWNSCYIQEETNSVQH